LHARYIELAGEVDSSMPEWVLGNVIEGISQLKKTINGSSVLVLGVAYKKNVDDMSESPSVELMELLQAKGAKFPTMICMLLDSRKCTSTVLIWKVQM